jgi:succinate dehydrogenase/fumarate reductase flavoprotein subunit
MAEPEVDLSKKYDAVIIGSGAAGGMAAHVLTTHGLQVLLLEAPLSVLPSHISANRTQGTAYTARRVALGSGKKNGYR